MNPSPSPAQFTVADFNRMGSQSGFHYRLPQLSGALRGDPETLCIAEGRVETHAIRPGLTLVLSDVRVHQHYEATSMMSPRFSAIVMLQGNAQTRIDRHDDVRLAAHSGVSALYGDTVAMTGIHAPGQRLRSVNLSLSDPDGAGDDPTSELIWKALRSPSLRLRRWQVQGHLLQAIEHLLDCGWDGPLQAMLREGVATQLLAHALATLEQRAPADSAVSERDRQLLERVRERLYNAPGEEHTLDDLARLACMSPSTLRAKFQAAYQRSVFSWLRERRLEVAREQLAQGCSVQQAAHFVGYRHATNFATAFRERYGIAPSELN
ncbi:hypothetical protein LMG26841_04397 [Achromobacter dolens]|uniref:HTH araC/xylS-type domain-containing protein n=2 Tax=Alcaligenaceae TaxID=506 RepID=A0A6S7E7M8_9BURK|nr:hypothetical protein LMG26840_05151 [Achromobacter dolens]CAB3899455.1 hypothetical protein LMG26841_04397 [Achromobacter dolens]CUJ76071.1 transcriptional activator FtrA [Achromobacter dolens]